MTDSAFRERLVLFRARGGKRATAHWLIRQLVRLDVYTLYGKALRGLAVEKNPGRSCEFIALRDHGDLGGRRLALIQALDSHCGCGVEETLRRGGRIYAVVRGDEVLSQVRIDLGGGSVDTPADLRIDVGDGNAFLSYLFTPAASRRCGWAKVLVSMTCAALADEGFRHCVCHVQATNLRSANAFEGLGWKATGWLLASASGRPLGIVNNRLAGFDGLGVRANPG